MAHINILVVHGPNLNLLGIREPQTYGSTTLEQINHNLQAKARQLQLGLFCYQSNHEGTLVDIIHQALGEYQGIIINAGAYTHTSIAIRDALAGVGIPTVEVHLSNIYGRDRFRHHSYIAPIAIGQISGFGANSYILGLQALADYLQSKQN